MANELKELIRERRELSDQADAIHKRYLEVGEKIALRCEHEDAAVIEHAPKRRSKPKARKPNHDATVKRYTDFEPTYGGCLCGCAETMDEGATFRPGHQNQLRSIAKAVDAGRLPRDKLTDLGEAHAITAGWLKPVPEPEATE